MTPTPEALKCAQAILILEMWTSRQSHDRCWYYPDVFRQLCNIFDVAAPPQHLPPRPEFEEGCRRFQREQYEG